MSASVGSCPDCGTDLTFGGNEDCETCAAEPAFVARSSSRPILDHQMADAVRLLNGLRDLANPLNSDIYDRYLAPAITKLEDALFEYEMSKR